MKMTRIRGINRFELAGMLLAMLLGGAGCNILGPTLAVMSAGQTHKVHAEYAELAGKRVCAWVWVSESIRFDYPVIRLDLANHAKHFIMDQVDCEFVDPEKVAKFQRSNYHADRMSAVEIGKQFDADVVLSIQVFEFHLRPPEMPNLFQGRIRAQCALYDCTGELAVESSERELWSGRIDVDYPKKRPLNMSETTSQRIRSATLKAFGDAVAKKFYTHRVLAEE